MKERSCSILNIDKYNIIFIANKTLAGKATGARCVRKKKKKKKILYNTTRGRTRLLPFF